MSFLNESKQVSEFRKDLVTSMLILLPNNHQQQASSARYKHKLEETEENLATIENKEGIALDAMQSYQNKKARCKQTSTYTWTYK